MRLYCRELQRRSKPYRDPAYSVGGICSAGSGGVAGYLHFDRHSGCILHAPTLAINIDASSDPGNSNGQPCPITYGSAIAEPDGDAVTSAFAHTFAITHTGAGTHAFDVW